MRSIRNTKEGRQTSETSGHPPTVLLGEGGGPPFGLPSSKALHQHMAHSSVTANASCPLAQGGECWYPTLHYQRLGHGAPSAVKMKKKGVREIRFDAQMCTGRMRAFSQIEHESGILLSGTKRLRQGRASNQELCLPRKVVCSQVSHYRRQDGTRGSMIWEDSSGGRIRNGLRPVLNTFETSKGYILRPRVLERSGSHLQAAPKLSASTCIKDILKQTCGVK